MPAITLDKIKSFSKVRFECEGCLKKCLQNEFWRLGKGMHAPFFCSEACGKGAMK